MLNYQPTKVKSGGRDEVEGSVKTLVGKVKEDTGKVLGNRNMEARGQGEQVDGTVQKKVGEIKKVFDM
jgi:uncharacterized protein YjbJ (UPF0337 family)